MMATNSKTTRLVPWLVAALILGLLLSAALRWSTAEGADGSRWYFASLESGKIQGHSWGAGAKVPKNQPLKQLCIVVTHVFPPDPDAGYVESDETSNCGEVVKPTESVSIQAPIGPASSYQNLFTALYRPMVRQVVVVLGTGERKKYQARVAKIPQRAAKEIPKFRFFVALFPKEECVRRFITYDGRGKVIKSEANEAGCSPKS